MKSTCSLYLFIINSRADWCSANEVCSSIFSSCSWRILAFSSWLPRTKVLLGRWWAASFNSFTSSRYYNKQHVIIWYFKTNTKLLHSAVKGFLKEVLKCWSRQAEDQKRTEDLYKVDSKVWLQPPYSETLEKGFKHTSAFVTFFSATCQEFCKF